MQNDHEEVVRPFARIMANEVSQDEAETTAKKGLFLTLRSGSILHFDLPDFGGGA